MDESKAVKTGNITGSRASLSAKTTTDYYEGNPVLQQIKDRASQARKYYENVGLSKNGNLPRKSDVRRRLDAPPDKEDTKLLSKSPILSNKPSVKWIKQTSPRPSNSASLIYTHPHHRSGSWTDIKHHSSRLRAHEYYQDSLNPQNYSVGGESSNVENHQKNSQKRSSENAFDDKLVHNELSNQVKNPSHETSQMIKKRNSKDISCRDEMINPGELRDEIHTKKSVEKLKKLKLAENKHFSIDSSNYSTKTSSTQYSASCEDITGIEAFASQDHDFSNNTTQSLPPSTTHAFKVRPDTVTENSQQVLVANEKLTAAETNLETVRSQLEIAKNQDESFHVDKVDSFTSGNERYLQNFAHYDCQSQTFNFNLVLEAMNELKRKHVDTGASKASTFNTYSTAASSNQNSCASSTDNLCGEKMEIEILHQNGLVECCPYFITEVGGEKDREIFTSSVGTNASHLSHVTVQVTGNQDGKSSQARNVLTNHDYLSIVEVSCTKNPLPPKPPAQVSYGIERVDLGANYYRNYFVDKEHQNYMVTDHIYGPIIISLRKEKIECANSGNLAVHQYRIIIRTSELTTLRGSILEEALTPRHQVGHHGLGGRSCNPKDVIEHICKEIDVGNLKLAQHSPKLIDDLLAIDEQGLYTSYKIGVLYCRPGQTTEEEMYNNEKGSLAFNEFLQLLGDKVQLQGFSNFRGGLDVKTGSTGDESIFTEWNGYKLMFHVSTMLPFSANNPQQLLRKRHIGNDILTIVFQEEGSEPFSPKSIRSQFQHIFIIVRVINPCSDKTCYRVAVTRAKSIPRFGPAIPSNCMFRKSAAFREFLLTKVVNGENVAHHAGRFKSLAINTRQEYLKDAIKKYCTQQDLDSTDSKFVRFSFSARRYREKVKQNRPLPITTSCGAIVWPVVATDYNGSEQVHCLLGISNCAITLIEVARNKLIFSIPCLSVLGWLLSNQRSEVRSRELSLYFGRGEKITLQTEQKQDRADIVMRLQRFTKGYEAIRRQWKGGQSLESMGLKINYEGIIMEVYKPSKLEKSPLEGIQQSSRMVEISQTSVATLSKDDIEDLLNTTKQVICVLIPPNEDGTPRKCSMELYHLYPIADVIGLNVYNSTDKPNKTTTTTSPSSNQDLKKKAVIKKSKNSQKKNSNRSLDELNGSSCDVFIDNNSSTTNTLSSCQSNTSFQSSKTTDTSKSNNLVASVLPAEECTLHFNNNNIHSNVILTPVSSSSTDSTKKSFQLKNVGDNKEHKTQFSWRSPKSHFLAFNGNSQLYSKADQSTRRKDGKSKQMLYLSFSDKSISPVSRSPSNHDSKHKENIESKESNRSDLRVDVTSPTVQASLIKTGIAAKDKRRNAAEDKSISKFYHRNLNSSAECYDNVKQSEEAARKSRRPKMLYKGAITDNIRIPTSRKNLYDQMSYSAPKNTKSGRKYPNLQRANSDESILSSIELSKKTPSKTFLPIPTSRGYRRFPLPSTPAWNDILHAAKQAEDFNDHSSTPCQVATAKKTTGESSAYKPVSSNKTTFAKSSAKDKRNYKSSYLQQYTT